MKYTNLEHNLLINNNILSDKQPRKIIFCSESPLKLNGGVMNEKLSSEIAKQNTKTSIYFF
jgi:hypothetical protein